jgi:hypothetical protein
VEQNPFTALSEIIFELDDNRPGRPTLSDDLAADCGLFPALCCRIQQRAAFE